MSFENRQEDIEKLLSMKIGDAIYLNMFQGGGSCVFRETVDNWMLFEIPLYGGNDQYYGDFSKDKLDDLVRTVYDVFT